MTELSRTNSCSCQRLKQAENIAKLGYWELDTKTKTFYWSDEAFRIFGAKPQNLRQNLIKKHVYKPDFEQYKQQLQKLIIHQQPISGNIRIQQPNGHIVHCLYNAQTDGFGKIVGTFQDVSAQVIAHQELKQAQTEAEEANKAKSYFLAQASHDLRQPLQAIQLFADHLCNESLTPEQYLIAAKISASACNLSKLLNCILDISKIDSGGMKPHFENFNIKQLVENICQEQQQFSSLSIKSKINAEVIISDNLLIERIIRNLLSNAQKYAHSSILVTINTQNEHLIIRVIDDGCGIDVAEQEKIFADFYQSKDIPDNRNQGAGLGLGIVKRIVKMLNGDIRLKSRPNCYSAFQITLPIKFVHR